MRRMRKANTQNVCTGDSWKRINFKHQKDFARAVNLLNKIIEEVREYEPEAEYYLSCDNLNLMIASPHDPPKQGNIALSWTIRYADGGDW